MHVPLISSEFATDRIFASLPTPLSEVIPLAQAYGRTLAQALLADRDHPAYRRATMDGICFSSHDTVEKITGFLAAGQPPPEQWKVGDVFEIMTGASVPAGCDCLVPYESVVIDGEKRVTLLETPLPGRFMHEQGSDIAHSIEAVSAGSLIGAMELAIAASFGYTSLAVYRKPRVALISSGDEVVPIGDTPSPWQIRLSHAEMLRPALTSECDSFTHHHVIDDPDSIRALVSEVSPHVDLLIFTGGISKGKKDCIREVIESTHGAPAFHGVAQKPGKPMAFWQGAPLVFALPGNPLSVFATYCRYVAPFLRAWQGADVTPYLTQLAPQPSSHPELTLLLPVKKAANGTVIAMNFSNSGNILACKGAFGVVEVPSAATNFLAAKYSLYPYLSR